MVYKIGWFVRRFFYALVFKKISFYGYLGAPLVLLRPSRLTLGRKTRIFPGGRFEIHSDTGSIVIGNNCSIGQNFHCTAIGNLKIGANTLITSNVCITDIDHDYSDLDVFMAQQKYIHKNTEIGENSFIGFGAVVLAGSVLGKHCVVGANSVVRGDFPDYSVIAGVPAKIIKTINALPEEYFPE